MVAYGFFGEQFDLNEVSS